MLSLLGALFTPLSGAAPPPPGVGIVTHELTATPPLNGDSVWNGLMNGQAALLACVGDPQAPLPTVIRALDLTWTVGPGGVASGLLVVGAEPAGPKLNPCLEAAIGGVTWADPGPTPATLTARLVLLHNGYATLTRAPAAMLPTRQAGDNLNRPIGSEGSRQGAPPFGHPVLVKPGLPIILGALDKGIIDAEVNRHLSALDACYRRELPPNPGLRGSVSIKFTIWTDGTVSKSEVRSTTFAEPAVGECVLGAFRRMRFPSPDGGGIVIVVYPFDFAPG
jgi:hypothetical protein